MLTSAEHLPVTMRTKAARADRPRENRAAGGVVYRKVPVVVSLIETVDAAGAPLLLATSDAPNEAGRFFRVWLEGGRWKCRCGAFLSLGGCHHIGHLAAVSNSTPAGGG